MKASESTVGDIFLLTIFNSRLRLILKTRFFSVYTFTIMAIQIFFSWLGEERRFYHFFYSFNQFDIFKIFNNVWSGFLFIYYFIYLFWNEIRCIWNLCFAWFRRTSLHIFIIYAFSWILSQNYDLLDVDIFTFKF